MGPFRLVLSRILNITYNRVLSLRRAIECGADAEKGEGSNENRIGLAHAEAQPLIGSDAIEHLQHHVQDQQMIELRLHRRSVHWLAAPVHPSH